MKDGFEVKLATRTRVQAAVFTGAGRPLEMWEFENPETRAGEALVEVESCTLCGSDLHTVTGRRSEKVPAILGHEICGTVVAVNSTPPLDVDGVPIRSGDRVTWSIAVACGHCDRCAKGLSQKCRTLHKYGHESTQDGWPLSGGLAQIVHLKAGSSIVKLPHDIPAAVVCPANCATATVAAAFRVAGPVEGKRILVFGAGMLGLTATAYARSLGAGSVVICDPDSRRLDLARSFGADVGMTWNSHSTDFRKELGDVTGSSIYDVLLELSGSADAVEAALAHADVGAKVILVGTVMKSRPVSLDPESVVRRWLSIHGVHNYAPSDLRAAVDFLVTYRDRFPFETLVERTFSLNQVNEAVDYAIRQRPVRVAVVPEQPAAIGPNPG